MAGNGRFVAAALILLAGCGSGGGASQGGARVALLERPEPPGIERILLQDPAAISEVLAWMKANYQAPPHRNEMGAVLAEAAVILSKEGDPTFSGAPDQKWAIYGSIETKDRKTLIPREKIRELVEIFKKKGKPYDGKAVTGEYRPLHFPGSSPPIDEEK